VSPFPRMLIERIDLERRASIISVGALSF